MTERIPLEVITIDEPCPASWDQMAGGDRSRFCDHCQKHVYDFAAMPRDEAERLICASAGTLCARVSRDDHGTVITLDYAPAKRRRRWPIWAVTGLAAAITGALGLFAQARPKPRSVIVGAMIWRPTTSNSSVQNPLPGNSSQTP